MVLWNISILKSLSSQEGDKSARKDNSLKVKTTKSHTYRKLDWDRQPQDMENKFINYTTLASDVVIIMLLLVFTVLVNKNILCPPPDFILNDESFNISTCNKTYVNSLTRPDSRFETNDEMETISEKSYQNLLRLLKPLFIIPSRLPFLEELFLDRVCFCLEKSN